MKCPVCKQHTGFYNEPGIVPGTVSREEFPLYQRSYPKEPEYISPRCIRCYKKAEKKQR